MVEQQHKRQVVLDTETTGLSVTDDHRIIEVGCVEVIDRRITGKIFHQYIDPERGIDAGALEVHGISGDFLADKPKFVEIASTFKQFIVGAELIMHNAAFDIGFLDHELSKIDTETRRIHDMCLVLDTLKLARDKYPGKKNNLDALCKRYKIDNSNRGSHGALLDAKILANVYLAMTGGQLSLFSFAQDPIVRGPGVNQQSSARQQQRKCLRVIRASKMELLAHKKILKRLQKAGGN